MKFHVTIAAAVLAGPVLATPIDDFVAEPALNPATAAEVTATCDKYLAKSAELKAALEAATGTATLATTLRAYDDLMLVAEATQFQVGLVEQIAADAARRDAARACNAKASERLTAISLSPGIYARLKAIDAGVGDPVAARILARTLAAYDRAGVAGDAAARARITALQSKITADGIAFDANIANGRKTITAAPADLTGLPADYLAARPAGEGGLVTISTDYPDMAPVMSYAASEPLRQRLYLAIQSRAYPDNDVVLARLFTNRDALARELGRPDFATLTLEDKMVGTPAKARAFLADLGRITATPAARDHARMLARLKTGSLAIEALPQWSTAYASQLIRKEQYDVDPQEVRRYFAYDNVRDGIFRLTQDLFGVTIRPWATKVWDPAAQAFEVVDGGKVIGRFYLDTHPRPGKYSHANVVPIRFGIAGRALPVAALVTNFPAGDHKTGLMEHRDVETFLHEFGHLLHVMFSGNQAWDQANMGTVEWDFIEAPSQMLEEWVWDYETLSRFAVDAQGKPIPKGLVERMNRARYFGEAVGEQRGLALSNVSLAYHSGLPAADLTAQYRAAYAAYSPVPIPDGAHPQDSFGHLNGYSAFYYTYNWSATIAEDLFTRFAERGLRDPATARRYRELVLAPGGSKPAAALIADFLGRPFSLDAYRARLARGD